VIHLSNLVAAYAEQVVQNAQAFLARPLVWLDFERQWKKSTQAVLSLLILGHEANPQALWAVVARLDQRFQAYPDQASDEVLSIRLLEGALDACSTQIIEEAQASVAALYPGVRLDRGLLDGFWCVYASFPRASCPPPTKPTLFALF
jgi:hypothetical protein